jgi:pyridoxal phosphate enzyme (YggS family)
MSGTCEQIAGNLARVRTDIAEACSRSGRKAGDVQLVCVTKYARPEWIDGLLACGETMLGESRPQQLEQRSAEFPDHVKWHLLGQLQRNKVRRTLAAASLVHSVDSLRLLERIETIATDEGRRPAVLLQVNSSDDPSRTGFTSESLRTAWPRVCGLTRTDVRGLMTMAPPPADPLATRAAFDSIRDLAVELGEIRIEQGGAALEELSMGMSNDFEIAVEAGATLVRLGRTLFEGLDG